MCSSLPRRHHNHHQQQQQLNCCAALVLSCPSITRRPPLLPLLLLLLLPPTTTVHMHHPAAQGSYSPRRPFTRLASIPRSRTRSSWRGASRTRSATPQITRPRDSPCTSIGKRRRPSGSMRVVKVTSVNIIRDILQWSSPTKQTLVTFKIFRQTNYHFFL